MTIALSIALLTIAVFTGRDIAQRRLIRALKDGRELDAKLLWNANKATLAARADARAERQCSDKLIAAEQRRMQLLAEMRRNADRALGA